MHRWLITLTCLGTLCACTARAQPPSSSGEAAAVRQACREDFRKLCPGVRPGGGRIRDCMVAHRDELSPSCRDAVTKAMADRAASSH